MPRTGGPEPELILPIAKMGPAPLNVLSPEYQAYQSAARRADAHNKVAKAIKGLHGSLNPYRDQAIRIGGQTINVLARRSGDAVVGDSQWLVEINKDKKPFIRAGSLIFKSITDILPADVANYNATTGWTHSSVPTSGDLVCFKLTLDVNVAITQIDLDVRNTVANDFYVTTPAAPPVPEFINTLWLPIALISVVSEVMTVKAQFVSGPVRLRQFVWDTFWGYGIV